MYNKNLSLLSQPSQSHYFHYYTVPALICRNIPNISVGETTTITVSWSYNHTGGLPLTNLSVQHTILDIDTMEETLTMTDYLIDTDVTTLNVYSVLPGYKYRFRVTATNAKGPTSVDCPPAVIGRHAMTVQTLMITHYR